MANFLICWCHSEASIYDLLFINLKSIYKFNKLITPLSYLTFPYRFIVIPVPFEDLVLINDFTLSLALSDLPHPFKNFTLTISVLALTMFHSLNILTWILFFSGECVSPLSVKLSVLEVTYILVSICVYNLSLSIELIVGEVAFVLIFLCLFINTLPLFSPIAESALIIWLFTKTLLPIPMRNIIPPLPFIMVLPWQVY